MLKNSCRKLHCQKGFNSNRFPYKIGPDRGWIAGVLLSHELRMPSSPGEHRGETNLDLVHFGVLVVLKEGGLALCNLMWKHLKPVNLVSIEITTRLLCYY